MLFRLQPSSGVPLYLQIVQQVRYLVASQQLRPGAELPAIRTLAEQLVINPNTVARAYLELERAGLVVKRHGSGSYIAEAPPPATRGQHHAHLAERADALLAEAVHMGVSFDDLLTLIRSRHEKMTSASR